MRNMSASWTVPAPELKQTGLREIMAFSRNTLLLEDWMNGGS